MHRNELLQQIVSKGAFIFDMDGTILDLEELNHGGYSETVKKYFNLDLSNHDYQTFFSGTKTADGFNGYLKNCGVSAYDVDDLIVDFRKSKRESLIHKTDDVVHLKDGIRQFLKKLKSHEKKTCLATSTVKEFVDIIVDHYELRTLFDVILTADDVTVGKPSPKIYQTAANRLKVTAEDCVVFEDSKSGIESAKNAQMYCVGIVTKGRNDAFVNNADIVIQSFTELLPPFPLK